MGGGQMNAVDRLNRVNRDVVRLAERSDDAGLNGIARGDRRCGLNECAEIPRKCRVYASGGPGAALIDNKVDDMTIRLG